MKDIETLKVMKPKVITDGGPWAFHNMPCAVYQDKKAVLNLGKGIYGPSWKAKSHGYILVKVPKWLRRLLKKYEI